MAVYHLEPGERTLHGSFSNQFAPVLTIDSGDTVHYQLPDAGWGSEAPALAGGPRKKYPRRDGEIDQGHALCGPVAIRGAQPGMALEITIERLVPGSYGWTYAGGWSMELNERFGTREGAEQLLLWALDAERGIAKNQFQHEVSIRPFLGVMGVAPAAPGYHSTWPPRLSGGNLDCKALVAGSTLYLPIQMPGALVSVGDGHAAQGDGEISSTAIECPMDEAILQFRVVEGMALSSPRAKTAEGWITFGFHENLNEASYFAANAMLDLMMERFALARKEVLALASVVVDLRITQICNGVWGVHAVLADDAVR
jgi:acetamidase/formamidase